MKLPELPLPLDEVHVYMGERSDVNTRWAAPNADYYSADDMHAYAQQALAQQPSAEVVAWRWEEREYNGTGSVADSDKWTKKKGFKVPQYTEQEKWIRSVQPYAYANPPAAREVTEEMVKVAETTRVKILRGLTAYGSDTIEELREIAMRVALTAAMNQETGK